MITQSQAEFAEACRQAADLIANADGLLVAAGAGMGVDSGLPDFRGPAGFWAAYPALGRAGIQFTDIANPAVFQTDPRLAWGFYGHRLQLYRRTVPHAGFALLAGIGARLAHGLFVFTSNVDGAFQKAGFDAERIVECHGSIHHLQCLAPCEDTLRPADDFKPEVDESACRLRSALPRCPHCDRLLRPNILMFGDWQWLEARSAAQQRRMATWRSQVQRLVVLEIGAGTAVPTVRYTAQAQNAPLVRINPRESARETATVTLRSGALAGIRGIAEALGA